MFTIAHSRETGEVQYARLAQWFCLIFDIGWRETETDRAARLASQSRGYGATIPLFDLADLYRASLVHDAYKFFGAALVSGDSATIRRLIRAIAPIHGADRYLVWDLVPYAALSEARRFLPDDAPQDDRHALDLTVTRQIMRERRAGRLQLAPWLPAPRRRFSIETTVPTDIHSTAYAVLLGVSDDGTPLGRLLRQLLGPRRGQGHAWVGIESWMWDLLGGSDMGAGPDYAFGRPGWHHVKAAVALKAVTDVIEEWADELDPGELLELARAGRLNCISYKATDRLYDAAEATELYNRTLLENESVVDDYRDADGEAPTAPWDGRRKLRWSREDTPLSERLARNLGRTLADADRNDASPGLRDFRLSDARLTIDAAIQRAPTEEVRQQLRKMVDIQESEPDLDRHQIAARMGIEVQRVKRLREILRDLRQPTAKPASE